jgi:hypothetical protein
MEDLSLRPAQEKVKKLTLAPSHPMKTWMWWFRPVIPAGIKRPQQKS